MSNLRITGGQARGRTLVGELEKGVRPTSARVREAWFSMVGHDLHGITMLDAFSGSGIMAFEAWSRGATVTAIERQGRAVRAIQARARDLGATLQVLKGNTEKVLPTLLRYDLVFADPPYADEPEPWLARLAAVTGQDLWFETDKRARVPTGIGELELQRSRAFGGTTLHHFRRSTC